MAQGCVCSAQEGCDGMFPHDTHLKASQVCPKSTHYSILHSSESLQQPSLSVLCRHRAINLFLKSYRDIWLKTEHPGDGCLIEDVTVSPHTSLFKSVASALLSMMLQGPAGEEAIAVPTEEGLEEKEEEPQPLSQLITAFSRSATTQNTSVLEADFLYIAYARIMSESCHGTDDDDDEGEGGEEGDPGASLPVRLSSFFTLHFLVGNKSV